MNTETRVKRLLASAVAGGLLCTLLDQVHVRTATLAYPHPALFGQDWWVLPNFTAAVLSMLLAAPRITRAMGESSELGPRPHAVREMLTAVAALAVVYASSGVFNQHPRVLTAVFLALFALRMAREGSRSLMAVAVLMALCGTAVEATLSALGMFYYRVPDVFGVPMWLPGIYLHGAFAVRGLLRAVLPEVGDEPQA